MRARSRASDLARSNDTEALGSRTVENAVMRALFPHDATAAALHPGRGREHRARRGLVALSARGSEGRFRAKREDRKAQSQGRLHSDHLRDADHHGAADGLLWPAGPERRRGEDRGLGRHPRQDDQQGIRRRAHALADAARDHARRRREADSVRCPRSRTSTARRSRSRSSTRTSAIRRSGRASSSRCRSTIRCTTTCCAITWPSTGSTPTTTSRSARCRRPRWSRTCAPTTSTASSRPTR